MVDAAVIKLDKRDMKLIALLRQDSRTPISLIAKQLSVNRDTVKYRMQRLERARIIRRYYAEIDRSVFGYLICYVFLLIDEKNRRKHEGLIRELTKHPNTEAIREYNGNWDVKWTLIARHVEELDDIIMRLSMAYKGVIVEKDTLIVVRWSKASKWAGQEQPPDTDETDLTILRILADDARTSAAAIGTQAGLSADAVIKRIKRLTQQQVIRRFTINADPERMGKQWFTFVLQMKQFDETHQHRLKEFIRLRPDIIRCYKTIGTWDIVMTGITDDAAAFHLLFKDIKTTFSDIIRNYDAYPGYRERFITSFPRVIWEKEEKKATSSRR